MSIRVDGLGVVEQLCMPPKVPAPKPGRCPGARSGVRKATGGVRKATAKTGAKTGAPKTEPSRLERAVTGSPVKSTQFAGRGTTGTIHKITYEDGTEAIRKRPSAIGSWSPVDQLDAEELAADVAAAIGARVPQVYRSSPTEMYHEYVDDELGELFRDGEVTAAAATPDGIRLGLLDVMIENQDRNRGNFFIDLDTGRRVTGIDHAVGWWNTSEAQDLLAGHEGPFVRQFYRTSNPLTTAEYDRMRPQVMALRPKFERMGRLDWFGRSVDMFEQMAARAADRPVGVG